MDYLNIPMNPKTNEAKASSVKEYICTLLKLLLEEREVFSGKRPFGNSGWDGELIIAWIKSGVMPGMVDEDDYLIDYSEKDYEKCVDEAIKQLLAQK